MLARQQVQAPLLLVACYHILRPRLAGRLPPMAFSIPCPKCGIRLRCASRLPGGARFTCPSCQNAFVTPDSAESEDRRPRVRQAVPREEIPDAVILDDEPDDDRPPVRRSSAADRRRERPRPPDNAPDRRAPPRRRRSIALPILVGSIAGAVVIGALVASIIYFLVRDATQPASVELLAHVPTDAIVLSGYDLEELAGSPAFRKALERRAPPDLVELDRAGLRSTDLSRILVARTVHNGNTCVVRFKDAPVRSKYLHADLPGKPYAPFSSLTGNYRFGYFADSRTLVLADREAAMGTLQEKGSKTRISNDLKDMIDRVRGPVWRASGRISTADSAKLAVADDGVSLRIGPCAGTAAWVIPDGPLADVRFECTFESRSEAAQGAGILRGMFINLRALNDFGQLSGRTGIDPSEIADVRRGYEEADVSESGNRVTARVRLPAGEALRAVGSVRN